MFGFVVVRVKCYLTLQFTITITVDVSVDNNNCPYTDLLLKLWKEEIFTGRPLLLIWMTFEDLLDRNEKWIVRESPINSHRQLVIICSPSPSSCFWEGGGGAGLSSIPRSGNQEQWILNSWINYLWSKIGSFFATLRLTKEIQKWFLILWAHNRPSPMRVWTRQLMVV